MSQLGQDTEQKDEDIDEQIDRRLPSEQTIWGLHFLSSRSSIDSNVMLTPESCGSPRELPYAHMDIQPPYPFWFHQGETAWPWQFPLDPESFQCLLLLRTFWFHLVVPLLRTRVTSSGHRVMTVTSVIYVQLWLDVLCRWGCFHV